MNTTWRSNNLCMARLALAAACGWLSADVLFAQSQDSGPVMIVNPSVPPPAGAGGGPPRAAGTPKSPPAQSPAPLKIENPYFNNPFYPTTGYPPFGAAPGQPLAPADAWSGPSGIIVNPYALGSPEQARAGTVRLPAIGALSSNAEVAGDITQPGPLSPPMSGGAHLPAGPPVPAGTAADEGLAISTGPAALRQPERSPLPANTILFAPPEMTGGHPVGAANPLSSPAGGFEAVVSDRFPARPAAAPFSPAAAPALSTAAAPPPAEEIRFELPEGVAANPFASGGTGSTPPRELFMGPTNRWAIGSGPAGLSQPPHLQPSSGGAGVAHGEQVHSSIQTASSDVLQSLQYPSRLLPMGSSQRSGLSADPFEAPLPMEAAHSGGRLGQASSAPGWLTPEANGGSPQAGGQTILQASGVTTGSDTFRVQQGAHWREPSVGAEADPFEATAAESASEASTDAAASPETEPEGGLAASGAAADLPGASDLAASPPPSPTRRDPQALLADLRTAAQSASTHRQLTDLIDACRVALAERQAERDAAEEFLTGLSQLAAWAHNRRGELLTTAGMADAALADFEAAVQVDPKCWLAIHNRGITLAERGRHAEAERDFSRVIELQPGFALAHQNRAELRASLGRTGEAIQDYTAAIERSPAAMTYALRGFALQRLGQHEAAVADFDESLRLWPANVDAHLGRGHARAESGDFAAAIVDFESAIGIDPAHADAHRSLAWLLATCPDGSVRDPARSLAAARRAAALAGMQDGFVLDTLAAAYASADRFADAVRYERQAIEAAPELAELFEKRLAHYQQGQPYHGQQAPAVRAASYQIPPSSEASVSGRQDQ